MKLRRILSLVVALAMVAAFVPAMTLTASAEVVYDETTLLYDSTSYEGTDTAFATGDTYEWFAIQFDLADISSYKDFAMTDADGVGIAGFCDAWFAGDGFYAFDGERSTTVNSSTTSSGGNIKYNDCSGTATIVVLYEKEDGSYNVTVTANGTRIATATKSGTPNGIALPAQWDYSGWGSGVSADTANDAFTNVKIYGAEYPETTVTVVASYTVNGEEVASATKTYDSTSAAGADFDEKYYSVNGSNTLYYAAAATLSESGEIAMEALENSGDYAVGDIVEVGDKYYKVTGSNLIPNGNFLYGLNGWYNASDVNNAASSSNFTVNGNGTVTIVNHKGSGDPATLDRSWAVETGKTYLFTVYTSVDSFYKGFMGSTSLGLIKDGTTLWQTPTANEQSYFVYENNDYSYLGINSAWMGSEVLGNFGLYEVEDATVNVAINYVCDGATVASENYVGYDGQTITLPETVSDDENIYTVDNTSYILASDTTTDEVTVTKSASRAIESIEGLAVSAFEGTVVTLPATVEAAYNDGTTEEVAVTWAADDGTATEITGTVEGYEAGVKAVITRYEVTSTMEDISIEGGNLKPALPNVLTGDYAIEFTYAPTQLDNNWFYISNTEDGMFGEGVGFGTPSSTDSAESATMSARYGAGDKDLALATVAINETYRVMIEGNAADGTYDISFTSSDGTIQSATGVLERSASSAATLAYFCAGANNESGVYTVTDIKLNYALNEITVNYVADGETIKFETVKSTAVAGDAYAVTQYQIISGDDAKYYVTNASETISDDLTVTVALTKLGDAYTTQAGNVYTGNVTDDGTYTGFNTAAAMNWGTGSISSEYDRIGVAVLDVPTVESTQTYQLDGTIARSVYDSGSVTIYAISYEDYLTLDMSDVANVVAEFTDEAQVASFELGQLDTGSTFEGVQLGATALEAAAGNAGKVVLLMNASGHIFALDSETMAINAVTKDLGVTIIDGASVRVSGGVDEEGKVAAALEGSGLRFSATVDKEDTLMSMTGAVAGIMIYPQDNPKSVVYIDANKYQDDTTFTAVLTNIKEGNYNRTFVAKPYVLIDGEYHIDSQSCARSIYQVSAGLLTAGSAEEAQLDVLNAYVNQVGIRLTLSDGAITAATTYTGDVFFEVTSATEADGVYTITLTAANQAQFKEFWKEYVRVNNNNSKVKAMLSDGEISSDGTSITFTFTPTTAE